MKGEFHQVLTNILLLGYWLAAGSCWAKSGPYKMMLHVMESQCGVAAKVLDWDSGDPSGELCVGSLCMQHGLEQCDCVSSSQRERCQLCCQVPGQGRSCASTSSPAWARFFNGSKIPLLPGSPCRDKSGYCDKFHVCRFVDEDGPLARVKNFILDFIEMEDVATWMKTRWWAILLMVLTLAAMMAATVFLFGRTVDTETETDERTSQPPDKKISVGHDAEKQHSFFYWEREIYIETMRQEYETII